MITTAKQIKNIKIPKRLFENFERMGSKIILFTKPPTISNWKATMANIIMIKTIKSKTRSATTDPSNESKGIFSRLLNTPQRDTSPKRGTAKFAKYPTITA